MRLPQRGLSFDRITYHSKVGRARSLMHFLLRPVHTSGVVVCPGEVGLMNRPEVTRYNFFCTRYKRIPCAWQACQSWFRVIWFSAQVTQCLGAIQPAPWFLAVAAPSGSVEAWPQPADLRAFRIPHGSFVKLHAGTWHAGPLFAGSPHMDFFNLVRGGLGKCEQARLS